LVLAPVLDQASIFFRKAMSAYRALGKPVAPKVENRLSLELVNGSRIVTLPGQEANVRGYTADLILIDEASRIPDELYREALRPMLIRRPLGRLVLLSTPYGKRGIFYHEWTKGTEWEKHQIKATENPSMDIHKLLKERDQGERYFAQEFLCEFVETEDQVFSHDVINDAFDPEVKPLWPNTHKTTEDTSVYHSLGPLWEDAS
jgi:hypothetical protein